MIIGKVVGHVVSTRKNENLIGQKLLIVEPLESIKGNMGSSRFIAIDNVGAGVGETVLVATGSAARVGYAQLAATMNHRRHSRSATIPKACSSLPTRR